MDGAPAAAASLQLRGLKGFVRSNPLSDKFGCQAFHHIEFWCGDATTTSRRFMLALGMQLVAKSDHSTGNTTYASYVLRSHDLTFVFTAPYSAACTAADELPPHPGYHQELARCFIDAHGTAVRAVGLLVDDVVTAYFAGLKGGARPRGDGCTGGGLVIAEMALYGDVVLRLTQHMPEGATPNAPDAKPAPPLWPWPRYVEVPPPASPRCFGLMRLDHCVGNVPSLAEAVPYITAWTGFHEFAEFVAEDVGTVDSGLNSVVLANNNEMVLLPLNEPTFGTKRRSQIQTFLEQNEGPGVQHLALKTDDIFETLRAMRAATELGGFEFLRSAGAAYYAALPARCAGVLSAEQCAACEELGVLVDRDDQGTLLQIFTKPLGDRPTLFIEIIQRIGCEADGPGGERRQAGGCGGFGKGNFTELFKSIEEFEATLKL